VDEADKTEELPDTVRKVTLIQKIQGLVGDVFYTAPEIYATQE